MPSAPCTSETSDHLATLRRLVGGRWVVLAILALLALLGPGLLDIPVPQVPLLGIIAIAGLFNGLARWRVAAARAASACELFVQLLFDLGTLSAVVFFSGGAANPLVSLLLPPVAIAALTLPARFVAVIAGIAIAAYSLLMFFFVPLPLPDATRATRLHLGGMWLIFVVSAAMIGWIIVRMTERIRQRDAELAAAREQALRDERVMAMGTLAAGAAHELGTPLGTMALLAGELANDNSLSAPVREDIALLRQQIGVCKEIITGLSRRCRTPGECPSAGRRPLAGQPAPALARRPAAGEQPDDRGQRRPGAGDRCRSAPGAGRAEPAQQCRQRNAQPAGNPARLVHGYAGHRHPRPRPRLSACGPRPWRPGRLSGP